MDNNVINHACTLLAQGDLAGMPTETVYGLAGDATNPKAIAAIYALKGRPTFNPLIIHTYTLEKIADWVVMNEMARTLATHFWPGPLTLVLPRSTSCPIDLLASAGLPTLAVRIPSHPVALALLRAFDKPVAAPSANLSNHLSPTTKAMVEKDFPYLFVLEGGASPVGLESTIIGFEEDSNHFYKPVLYRPGGIATEAIENVIGLLCTPSSQKVQAPGMLKKHYSPRHSLRLNAFDKKEGEVLLGFAQSIDTASAVGITHDHTKYAFDLNLSPAGDVIEAAANLYAMLHELDQRNCAGIAVSPIPHHGLGRAINDRLSRAAAR